MGLIFTFIGIFLTGILAGMTILMTHLMSKHGMLEGGKVNITTDKLCSDCGCSVLWKGIDGMFCPDCGHIIHIKPAVYHWDRCGFDNLFVRGI